MTCLATTMYLTRRRAGPAARAHCHEVAFPRRGAEALHGGWVSDSQRSWKLSELLVDVLGVTDVDACFRHRVTTIPSVTRCG